MGGDTTILNTERVGRCAWRLGHESSQIARQRGRHKVLAVRRVVGLVTARHQLRETE